MGMQRFNVGMQLVSANQSKTQTIDVDAWSADQAKQTAEADNPGWRATSAKPDLVYNLSHMVAAVVLSYATKHKVKIPVGQAVLASHILQDVASRVHQTAEEIGKWIFENRYKPQS